MVSAKINFTKTAATNASATILQYFLIFTANNKIRKNHKKYSKYLAACTYKRVKPYVDRSKNIWFVRTNNFELYELFKKSRADLSCLENLISENGKRAAFLFIEGFFDAEGCVKLIKESSRITPKVCLDVTNTNLEILLLIKRLLLKNANIETGICSQKPHKNRKIAYHLRIYRK